MEADPTDLPCLHARTGSPPAAAHRSGAPDLCPPTTRQRLALQQWRWHSRWWRCCLTASTGGYPSRRRACRATAAHAPRVPRVRSENSLHLGYQTSSSLNDIIKFQRFCGIIFTSVGVMSVDSEHKAHTRFHGMEKEKTQRVQDKAQE